MMTLLAVYLSVNYPVGADNQVWFQRCGSLVENGSSYVRRVSDDGQHAVGWATDFESQKPARFTKDVGMEDLGYLFEDEDFGEAFGVNHDGSMIIGNSGWISAFVWRHGEGMTQFLAVESVRRLESMSVDGAVLVGSSPLYAWFRYDVGGTLDVVPLGALQTNGDGSYICGDVLSSGSNFDAALWCQDLPLIVVNERSQHFDKFSDVSADGSVCTFPNSTKLQFWHEELGIVKLPGLFQTSQTDNAWALSADAQVIVGECVELSGGTSAVIWTAESGTRRIKDVLTSLGVSVGSFHLTTATDISADGTTICGNGGPSATSWPNEGWMCRIPRTALSPYSARPNYVKPIYGSITAGDRRGTFKPEDSRLEFTSGVTPTFNSAPITVEFSATQARTYGKLDFDIDLQVNKSGLQQSLDLWDWDLNNWVQVDSRAATKDADQLVSLSFPLGHWYVRYDGRVKARLRIKPSLPQAQPGFKAKVDYVAWKVTPPQ